MPDREGYPRSRTMAAVRSTDTKPERALRSALHALGFRYRLGQSIHPDSGRVVKPDLVFVGRRVAVFVDGCFWHRCPEHFRAPGSSEDYWVPKIERNVERDRATNERLAAAGWTVIRVWEHEVASDAAERAAAVLTEGGLE